MYCVLMYGVRKGDVVRMSVAVGGTQGQSRQVAIEADQLLFSECLAIRQPSGISKTVQGAVRLERSERGKRIVKLKGTATGSWR